MAMCEDARAGQQQRPETTLVGRQQRPESRGHKGRSAAEASRDLHAALPKACKAELFAETLALDLVVWPQSLQKTE